MRLHIAFGLCLAIAVSMPAAAQTVLCHDPERDLVVRTAPDACKGVVVDEAEAARIRERRAEKVRQAIRPPAPAYEDTRISGSGTGFFVAASGVVLTNHHVVRQCAGVTIDTAAGNSGKAEVIALDQARDLALLRTDLLGQAVARFRNESTLRRPENLIVVGYPNRGMARVQPIASTGEFAGYGPPVGTIPRFAMLGEVRRGNSGGPVLDLNGLVVGVVFGKRDTVAASKAMGAPADDIGYAIPSGVAIAFLKENGITPAGGFPGATALTGDAVFQSAKGFVTRVICWK
jgi:S1-C subfamily serine protease